MKTKNPEKAKQARAKGYDGLYYSGPNTVRDEPEWAVFHPTQIKSVTGNNGDFNPSNPKITAAASSVNSLGKPIHDTPEGIANFWKWFKKSKVVDAQGKPLVVFHGTKSDFSEYDIKKFGASDEGLGGKGFYFTYNPQEASGYAENEQYGRGESPNVQPVYVSLQNPLIVTQGILPDGRKLTDLHGGGINSKGGEAVRKLADAGGHDGLMWVSKEGKVGHVLAFHANQVKSALGNNGNFSPSNPNITAGKETGEAAGVLFIAKDTGRVLFVLRSNQGDDPNVWCSLGGGVEEGESIDQAVHREVGEEAGFYGDYDLQHIHTSDDGSFKYHNHIALVPTEFTPKLNEEHTDYVWADKLPTPLHPGLQQALDEYAKGLK